MKKMHIIAIVVIANVVYYVTYFFFTKPPHIIYPAFGIGIPPNYYIHGIDVSRAGIRLYQLGDQVTSHEGRQVGVVKDHIQCLVQVLPRGSAWGEVRAQKGLGGGEYDLGR